MDVLHTALTELSKLAEISLAGLAPESVVQHMAPAGPMETSGLAKAQAIVARYQGAQMPEKTASPRVSNALVPGANHLTGAKKKGKKDEKRTVVTESKSLGGHVVGGAASGRLLSEFSFGAKKVPSTIARQSRNWHSMAAGAGLGAAEFARKRLVERHRAAMEKHANVLSPGMALRASQQVGKMSKGLRTSITPPLKAQVRGV